MGRKYGGGVVGSGRTGLGQLTAKSFISGLVSLLSLSGCHRHTQTLNDTFPTKQKQVQELVYQIYENFVSKNTEALEKMHFFSEKFSKFDVMGNDLLDSDKTKHTEHQAVAEFIQEFRFDRKKNIENLKVSVFGDTAIATFLLHYDAVLKNGQNPKGILRSTLVFVDTDAKRSGEWKIVHEHFSMSPAMP